MVGVPFLLLCSSTYFKIVCSAFLFFKSGMQSAALLDSMVGAKEAQGGSVFAVKEINNGTAAVVREEYGDKKIGFSLSFEGYLRVPADGSYLFQLENTDG